MNKKQKLLVLVAVVLAGATLVTFALDVVNRGSFSGVATTAGVDIYIPAQSGMIVDHSMSLSCETNGTVLVYRPRDKTTAQAAAATSTNLYVYTDTGKGTLGGITPVAADSVIIQDTGTTGWQLKGISAIVTNGVHTNDYMIIQLDATAICAADSPVYFCDAGDLLSIPAVAANDQTKLSYMFTSFKDKPIVVSVPAGCGASIASGVFDVER